MCVIVFVLINDIVRCISISSPELKILCRFEGESICAPPSVSDGF